MQHAKLSASGSGQWFNCPGSIAAQQGIPNESSPYAQEGTIAHELAEMCLRENIDTDTAIGEFTDDMRQHVQTYIDYVRAYLPNSEHRFLVESRVDFSRWVPKGFGTLDAAVIDYNANTVDCFDLKYGKGVQVSPYKNSQQLLYCLGLVNKIKRDLSGYTFRLHIHMPRKFTSDPYELDYAELMAFGEFAAQKAKEALAPDAPRIPGESQCRFCRAKADCPDLYEHTQKIIGDSFDELDSEGITDEQKRLILDNQSLITDFMQTIREQVQNTLMDGGEFPGYKLVAGRSNRRWLPQATEILESELGDMAFTRKLIGLGAAEKLYGDISDLTEKPEGLPTLVPETDRREKYTKNMFTNVK